MSARLPYAKQRLSAAIDRFLQARSRHEKAAAARWVSAWAHFTELQHREGLRRRMLQEPALRRFC
jgi:hypothetical protein